tara:strand:- start:40 stop:360 length:321 start_codon:yes stop_codon:yes gene_type:complete
MKLNRKTIRKMILKEMAVMGGVPHGSLTFEKIADIHRFVGYAAQNGRHWMFPQGVDHDTYATLNALYVQRIGRMDSNDPAALQEYATLVKQIPGADQGSIEEILDA